MARKKNIKVQSKSSKLTKAARKNKESENVEKLPKR